MEVTKNYKKELKELEQLPEGKISSIYIVPSNMYNGFWRKKWI